MSDISSIVKALKTVETENKALKTRVYELENTCNTKFDEIIALMNHKNHIIEELVNKVETKLDIFTNIEMKGDTPAASAKKPAVASKITTLAFLKKELTDNLLKHIDNNLYTNEDIERLKEHADVKKKKSGTDINNKIISLLHTEIKKNTAKFKILEELKDTYIQSIKNDELIE